MEQIIQFSEHNGVGNYTETMTSVEIAEVADRRHKDVLKAIRNMEHAWEKVSGRKFALTSYKDEQGKNRPCYCLNKRECLFVATKFNDEARAKLVIRWEQLETEHQKPKQLSAVEMFALQAQINLQNEQRLTNIEQSLSALIQERNDNHQLLLSAEISSEQLPEESESVKIRKLVNLYVKSTGMGYEDTWNSIYETLEYRYGHRIRAYKKINSDKSLLDVAIRNNLGQKVFNVISDMVRNLESK